MVSADNLPFDVLPWIFQFLTSGSDLVAVVLVSKSFSSGVLPLIYATVAVRASLVKRLAGIQSPFRTLRENTALRPFVRAVAIEAIPTIRLMHDPKFMLQVSQALSYLPNLVSFVYKVPAPGANLSTMLSSLVKNEKLKELKVLAEHVSSAQAELLTRAGHGSLVPDLGGAAQVSSPSSKGLETIWLKSPSSAVMCVLSKWIERNKHTLKRLTLLDSCSLSNRLLGDILLMLPNLTLLNVSNCPDINHWEVMNTLGKVPTLKSLSLHVLVHTTPPTPSFMHTALKHLHISLTTSHSGSMAPLRSTLIGFLTFVSACALESFTVESSDFVVFPVAAVSTLVQHHGKTLRRFNALHITVEHDGVEAICKGCPHLEQMCIELGTEIKTPSSSLTAALAKSKTLHTLVDSLDIKPHHNHRSTQVRLTNLETKTIFLKIPTLRRIINANRLWVLRKSPSGYTYSEAHRISHSHSPIQHVRVS